VKKRQRRLTGVDDIVLSLTARGLTTGEISAHFAEVYGASVSKDTISKITDKVVEEIFHGGKDIIELRVGPGTTVVVA
jgi:transposase-like protein